MFTNTFGFSLLAWVVQEKNGVVSSNVKRHFYMSEQAVQEHATCPGLIQHYLLHASGRWLRDFAVVVIRSTD